MPAPPASVARVMPTRTLRTGQPRCAARPEHTPAMKRSLRRTSGGRMGAVVMDQSKHGSGLPGPCSGLNRGPLRDRSGCPPVERKRRGRKDRGMNSQTPTPDDGHPTEPLPERDNAHPTEPLPPASPSSQPQEPAQESASGSSSGSSSESHEDTSGGTYTSPSAG